MILWKVALCLTALASQVTAAPKQPPNILLIYTDDLKAGEIEELYDLDTDPEELTNLALRAEHRTTLEQLRQSLFGELKRTGAEFVGHLPTTCQR